MTSKPDQTQGRTGAFARNTQLETLLKDLNSALWPAEERLLEQFDRQEHALVLVMGPLRSGTTLFTQWLANSGAFAYPTNLLSRFYHAPVIGAKVQLLLTDARYDFRGELSEFARGATYESENGKTRGVLAPNEFWYFWRRFLAEPARDVWTDDELRRTFDVQTLRREIAGLTTAFQKPFAAKGMLFNYNIPFLDSILDKVVFVQLKRDPVSNVASVLDARRRQLGSESAWYSFEIPEYESLKDLHPITQAAGQVTYINRAVDKGLAAVAPHRKLIVNYEDFCADPATTYHELLSKVSGLGAAPDYAGPATFAKTRAETIERAPEIQRALSAFS
jgi:hypothetical protein